MLSNSGKEQIGLFSGSVDVNSSNRKKQLTYTTRNYRQVVVLPDGDIQSSEGSLLFPVSVPPGSVMTGSDKSADMMKTISDMIAEAKTAKTKKDTSS